MIRYSCPGCQTAHTASDSRAGQPDTCPNCQTRFLIPGPDAPPSPGGGVEVAPCPKCGTRLSVAPADIGADVECPSCHTVFRAGAADAPRPARRSSHRADDDPPPRRRRRRDDDEDYEDDRDDRPRRSRRRSRRDEYDDDYDPPKQRIVYIILALFLGYLGIHNFYAGRTTEAVIQLVLWIVAWPLLCVYVGFLIFFALFVWTVIEMITVDRDGNGRRMA